MAGRDPRPFVTSPAYEAAVLRLEREVTWFECDCRGGLDLHVYYSVCLVVAREQRRICGLGGGAGWTTGASEFLFGLISRL